MLYDGYELNGIVKKPFSAPSTSIHELKRKVNIYGLVCRDFGWYIFPLLQIMVEYITMISMLFM